MLGEEEETLQQRFLVGRDVEHDGRLARVEMRLELRDQVESRPWPACRRRARPSVFVLPLLHRGEIGQDQFGGDDLDVAHRIDRAGDVMDVVVLEAADDLDDGVDFADVGEELVAEALARARALDQARRCRRTRRRRG